MRQGGKGFGGLGGFGDIAKLMKQAQRMQDDMVKAQEELANARLEGTAGGGAVKAVVNGKGRLISIAISREAVDPQDVEMLEDLVVSAINDAEDRAEEHQKDQMQGVVGDVPLPPGLF
jgi:DNA-binding YbaB/EbfC family protein